MALRTSTLTVNAAAYFPKWSRGYVDPASNFQSFANPIAVAIEDVEHKETEVVNQMAVTLIDPEYEPYKAWIVTPADVLNISSTFFSTITDVSGSISDVVVPISLVDNVQFQDSPPTAFFVSGYVTLSGSEVDPISCVWSESQKQMHITYLDSMNVSTMGLPSRWGGYDDTSIQTGIDPILSTITIDRAVSFSGERLLIDHTVVENILSGDTATDVLQAIGGNTVTVPLSGIIRFVDTSTWTTAKYNSLIDFDNDGVIDQREVDEISQYIGYRRTDFSPAIWKATYDKYDIDGNGIIDNVDVNYVINALNTMSIKGSLIEFTTTGRWRFNVYTTNDGMAGTSSFYTNDIVVGSIRGQTYGSLTTQIPIGCKYGVYHGYIDAFIMANVLEHALYVIKFDSNNLLIDRVKFPLPMRATGSSLRGISLYQDKLFVLRTDSLGSTILMMDTKNGAIDSVINVGEIHSGDMADRDVYTRDGTGLIDPYGLTFIGGHKLATIDEGVIKVFLPIFDYATISYNQEGVAALHFREKYSVTRTNNPETIYPTYYYLFTQLDYFAMINGISRLPGEDNWGLKLRVLDVWARFPDRTPQGIVYGISRELGEISYRTYNMEQFTRFSGDVGNFTSLNIFIDNVLTSGTVEINPLIVGNDETYSVIKTTVVSGDYEINAAVDNMSMVVSVRS